MKAITVNRKQSQYNHCKMKAITVNWKQALSQLKVIMVNRKQSH